MAALLKKLQSAANDFRPKPGKPRAVTFVTQAQNHQFVFRSAVIILLTSIATMSAIALWESKDKKSLTTASVEQTIETKPVAAKIIVKLEHDDKLQKVAEKLPLPEKVAMETPVSELPPPKGETYNDIVLPAESLSQENPNEDPNTIAPAPESAPAINVVAQDLSDLPALHEVKHESVSAQSSIQNVRFHAERALTAEQLLAEAHRLLVAGDDQAALALYDQVLKRDKNNNTALEGKMFALQHTGQAEQAVEIGHRLVQLDPDNNALRANLVTALGQSFLPAAMTELEQKVAANPHDAAAQAALAKLEARRGYYEKAYNHLNNAIKIQPDNILYRLDLAVLYDRAGYRADAATLYRQVLRAAMNEDDPTHLSISLPTIRQRLAYLEMSVASDR